MNTVPAAFATARMSCIERGIAIGGGLLAAILNATMGALIVLAVVGAIKRA